MAFLFYYALLAVWPLLLWPAWRLAGWRRAWLLAAALAGIAATAHEIRILYGAPAAIRLDIPLIAIALVLLYGVAVAVMIGARWRKTRAILALVLLLGGGGLGYVFIEGGRESQRLSEVFKARDALLFEAKFRSLDAYASYFRTFDARPTFLPVGHWEAEDGGYFSRLIVNVEGQAWAFYRCGETECDYRSADPGFEPVGDPAEKRWSVTMAPSAGLAAPLRVTQTDPEHLTIEGRGEPSVMTKTPPPIDPAPATAALDYLGPFVQMDCLRRHAAVRQLWLWREDERLYGVGIFSTLVAGARASFVSPLVLGEAVRHGDSWSFDWRRDRQSWTASITLDGPEPMLKLERNGEPMAEAALKREAIFRDEVIELAPLTGKADWDHWFDIVLTGHHSSGDVPACD